MTDHLLVLRKLSVLNDHVGRVRRRRPADRADFDNVDIQDPIAMSLFVAIQEASDIATHIASDEDLGLATSYAHGFELLGNHGVLEAELAKAMARMAGLRNRLAHADAFVDAGRLYDELPSGLDTLQAFAAAIARHVGPTAPR